MRIGAEQSTLDRRVTLFDKMLLERGCNANAQHDTFGMQLATCVRNHEVVHLNGLTTSVERYNLHLEGVNVVEPRTGNSKPNTGTPNK